MVPEELLEKIADARSQLRGRPCGRPATTDRTEEQLDKLFHGQSVQVGLLRHGGHSLCLLPTSQASDGIVSSFFTSPAPSEGSHE
jgi:hypothetical protein